MWEENFTKAQPAPGEREPVRGEGVFLGRTGHGRGGRAAWAAGRHQTQTQAAGKSDRRPAVCSSESWTVETRQQEERTASQLAKGLDSRPGGQPLPQEASQPGSQPGSTQLRAGDRLREHPPAAGSQSIKSLEWEEGVRERLASAQAQPWLSAE